MIQAKEKFIRIITEQIEAEKNALVTGAGDNYSEIQNLRGRIQGLEWARTNFTEIWNRFVSSSDNLFDEEDDV